MSKHPENEAGLPYPTNTTHAASPTNPPYNTNFQTGPTGYPQPPPPYSSNYPVPHTSAMNPGYPNSAAQVTLVTVPTPVNYVGGLGSDSSSMVCPFCQATIRTKVEKHPSNMAYLSGFLIAIFGCFCGCCLIPCCMDSCKATEHKCPNCDRYLGKHAKYF